MAENVDGDEASGLMAGEDIVSMEEWTYRDHAPDWRTGRPCASRVYERCGNMPPSAVLAGGARRAAAASVGAAPGARTGKRLAASPAVLAVFEATEPITRVLSKTSLWAT